MVDVYLVNIICLYECTIYRPSLGHICIQYKIRVMSRKFKTVFKITPLMHNVETF